MRAANDGDYGRSSQRHDPFPHQRHGFTGLTYWHECIFIGNAGRCCCVKLDWRSSVDRSEYRQSGSCSVGAVDSLTDALSFLVRHVTTRNQLFSAMLCVSHVWIRVVFAERLGSPVSVLGTIVFLPKGDSCACFALKRAPTS